ncbi:hypothetical protein [Candidatus Endolissoclinum faulkneri]|nr:hypothetical protein [Candidatus Endolissoclinum faulkneri]
MILAICRAMVGGEIQFTGTIAWYGLQHFNAMLFDGKRLIVAIK